jgi:hypothetical protein
MMGPWLPGKDSNLDYPRSERGVLPLHHPGSLATRYTTPVGSDLATPTRFRLRPP